ncbi:helix-turn-helix domain-containing protein [Xanthocytophaga agilis]|uniref:Helix-turn-helix domain-containing protein n=1 Tax=Xanthocytophaga agilis TaxID=3048010 RepID=A0AAE3UFT4_9BACT|nr:helix-turn-helix domain-containing protein [Xanthocytophaga agilis]MDJ1501632.1 helix-turn-helix domain-containing protein [Xanthocytophaga agilis]
MNKKGEKPYIIQSISEMHQHLGLPKPKHPMISVFWYEDITNYQLTSLNQFVMGFYCIAIKRNYAGKLRYGQRYYDYDEGVMAFISPNQLLSHIQDSDVPIEGVCLLIHPHFLAGHSLIASIKKYGFFSYEMSEALHLSEEEDKIFEQILSNIKRELYNNIDQFSRDVIIAQIELLLHYSNRFYNRQFITRKIANDEIVIRLENLLDEYFNDEETITKGIPTVQFVAKELNISPDYLSDMLKSITGQTTQQHIHNKVIEKGKELLSTTSLSVSEIAYQLGFEYPSSFNKLFKSKTRIAPLEFRASFN